MKFCKICSNMYYIKINDVNSNALVYYCRNCGDEETMITKENNIISKTVFKNEDKDFNNIINEYTFLDPCLPRTNKINCPDKDCESNKDETVREIIYIRYDDVNIKYVYLCSSCKTVWKQ